MMPDVYFAVPRESEVTFRGAQESDFGQLKKLWSKCFSEGTLGVDLIFSKLYRPENCFVAVSERGIAAQLDLIPVFVNGERAHYLYGACTDPVFQHRKIMRHLISYALDRAKERGDCLSLLYPANVELYSFYEKSGYKGCFGESVYIVERSKAQGLASEPSANNTDLYDFRQSLLPQDAVIWSRSEFEFAIEYNEIYGGKAVSVSGGYALVSGTENGRAEVYEFLCRPGCESELLGGVLAASDAAEFVIRVPKGKDFFGADNEGLPVGMFLSLSDNKTENVYFGLTFE